MHSSDAGSRHASARHGEPSTSLKAHGAKIDESIASLKKESGESLHLIEKAEAKHEKVLYKFDPVKKEANSEQQ